MCHYTSSSSNSSQPTLVNTEPEAPVMKNPPIQFVPAGEQLITDYHVHELPVSDSLSNDETLTVNAALIAHIEMLEAENAKLREKK